MENHKKICLVTGATSGMGYVMANALAKTGATVVIVGRNKTKNEATKKCLIKETGNNDIHFITAELSEMSQVKAVAEQFNATYPRLDILMDNAGAYSQDFAETSEGLAAVFATNYLCPFLLTNLLLDKLKQSNSARIICTCSHAHKVAKLNFDYTNIKDLAKLNNGYSQSKLAMLMFVYEMARKLKGTHITINAFHPGLVNSNFKNHTSGAMMKLLGKIIYSKRFSITSEQGADTGVFLATSPKVEGVNGKYFVKRQSEASSKLSYDKNIQNRLWSETVELLGSLDIAV